VTLSKEMLRRRDSFILETTLAGNGAFVRLREAKLAGYRTLLVYIALRTAELHIERVRLRVAQAATTFLILTSGAGTSVACSALPRRCGWPMRQSFSTIQASDQSAC